MHMFYIRTCFECQDGTCIYGYRSKFVLNVIVQLSHILPLYILFSFLYSSWTNAKIFLVASMHTHLLMYICTYEASSLGYFGFALFQESHSGRIQTIILSIFAPCAPWRSVKWNVQNDLKGRWINILIVGRKLCSYFTHGG